MACELTKSEPRCCCGFKQDRCFFDKIGSCPDETPNSILQEQIKKILE